VRRTSTFKAVWSILAFSLLLISLAGCSASPMAGGWSANITPLLLCGWLFLASLAGLLTGCGGTADLPFTTTTTTTVIPGSTGGTTTGGSNGGSTTSGAPTQQLAFTSQPGGGKAYQYLPTFTVAVENLSGQVQTSDNGSTVTLSLVNPGALASIVGGGTAKTVNGVATFSRVQINEAGTYTLKATAEGVSTTSGPITITTLPIGFDPTRLDFLTDAPLSRAVRGDFNGDGKPDVATLSYDASGNIIAEVLLGNGDGTYRLPVATNLAVVGLIPAMSAVAAADFTGDGKDDLVVAAYGRVTEVTADTAGSGHFTSITPVGVNGRQFTALVAGHFEGDTSVDFAVGYQSHSFSLSPSFHYLNEVAIWHAAPQPSNGVTFNKVSGSTQQTYPQFLVAGHFDGTGNADFAIAGFNVRDQLHEIQVLTTDGTGQFNGTVNATPPSFVPTGLAGGDLNGDGIDDLAVTEASNNGYIVELMQGSNNGTEATIHSLTLPASLNTLELADLNGDGKADIVAGFGSKPASSYVQTMLGVGDGTFSAAKNTSTATNPELLFALDVNGDSKTDVLALTGNQAQPAELNVLAGHGDGSLLGAPAAQALGTAPTAVALGDVNGDGNNDVITIGQDNLVHVQLGKGDGTFQAALNVAPGVKFINGLAVADLDGDGKSDIVVGYGTPFGGIATVMLSKGDGTFQNSHVATGLGCFEVQLADVNGDGNLDLVTLNGGDNSVTVALGTGTASFGAPTNLAVPASSVTEMRLAHVTGQATPDIVVLAKDAVVVFPAGPNGTFGAAVNTVIGDGKQFVAADFDGDGKADLVVEYTSNYAGYVYFLKGNGDGTFAAAAAVAETLAPVALEAIDLDGNNKLDIVAPQYLGNDVLLLVGNGDGTFAPQVAYGMGLGPVSSGAPPQIAIGDVNGDGFPDLITADAAGRAITVLLHQ
jgi:hypothetical protein